MNITMRAHLTNMLAECHESRRVLRDGYDHIANVKWFTEQAVRIRRDIAKCAP